MGRLTALLVACNLMVSAADTLYSNGQPNTTSPNSRGMALFRCADNFTLASPVSVSSIRFWMVAQPNNFSGSITYAFYNDSSGALGSVVSTATVSNITPVLLNQIPGNVHSIYLVDFNLPTPLTLAPGTYWLELHDGSNLTTVANPNATNVLWAIVPGVSGNAKQSSVPNLPSGNTGQELAFQLLGSVITVTPPSTALRFVPLTPCRLVDTRQAYAGPRTGEFGPPQLAGASTRTITIPATTTCSVPQTAKAYVLNVTLDTVENQTGPVDYVTIWPAGEARPDFYTARTTTGGYIANAAIVKAGTGGAVNVYASNNVNLILDINGYFTDSTSTPTLLYYPVAPCRAVDTRGPVYSSLPAPYGNQRFQARETRTLRLPGSPGCQLPAAAAYSLQMTLAPGDLTNGNAVAFVTAWPTGLPQPNISNMNAYFGYAVANSAITPASSNGSIDVYAYDATNLIIDVNGYFAPDDGTGRGLSYYPVTQCRVMNTLNAQFSGSFGPPALIPTPDRTVAVPAGACTGLQFTARAWALNAWVVPAGAAMPYLSMWPSGTAWPNISQLNAFQGQTVANSGIVPAASNGSIDVRVAATTHAAIEVAGYFAP